MIYQLHADTLLLYWCVFGYRCVLLNTNCSGSPTIGINIYAEQDARSLILVIPRWLFWRVWKWVICNTGHRILKTLAPDIDVKVSETGLDKN